MVDVKLKPCPMCGSEAKMQHIGAHHYVVCSNYICPTSPKTNGYSVLRMAITAWNIRAEPDNQIIWEANRKISDLENSNKIAQVLNEFISAENKEIKEQLTQTQQALDIAKEALIYVNNRIFDLETGRIDLRENEYLTDSIRKIKTALKVIEGKV